MKRGLILLFILLAMGSLCELGHSTGNPESPGNPEHNPEKTGSQNPSDVLDRLLREGGLEPPETDPTPNPIDALLPTDKEAAPPSPEVIDDFIKHLGEQTEEKQRDLIDDLLKRSERLSEGNEDFFKQLLDKVLNSPSVTKNIDTTGLLLAFQLIPKDLQHATIHRAINEIKEGKYVDLESVGRAINSTQFSLGQDQVKILVQEGIADPGILKQFFERTPDAKDRLFSWLRDSQSDGKRSHQLDSIVSMLKSGDLSFTPDDSSTLAHIVSNEKIPSSNRTLAFQALQITDEGQSQSLFERLSTSSDPSARILAATLLKENDPRKVAILSSAVPLANSDQLREIQNNFPTGANLNLAGLSEANLKMIFETGKSLDAELGINLRAVALRELGKTSKPEDLIPYLAQATNEVNSLYLAAVDVVKQRPPEEHDLFTGIVKKMFNHLNSAIDASNPNEFHYNSSIASSVSILTKYPELVTESLSEKLVKAVEAKHGLFSGEALSLLGEVKDPKLIPLFLKSLSSPDLSFPASKALGSALAAHPDKVTPELKAELLKIFASPGPGDRSSLRHHLRQHLHPDLIQELDWVRTTFESLAFRGRPADGHLTVDNATQNSALDLFNSVKPGSPYGLAQRALALRYLVETKYSEASKMVEPFINQILSATENPENPFGFFGNQHNLNQLRELLTAVGSSGAKIDPDRVASLQERVNEGAKRIWNGGNPFSSIARDGRPTPKIPGYDSNVIPYTTAAWFLASIDPKNPNPTPSERQMLEVLKQLGGVEGGIPYNFGDSERAAPKEGVNSSPSIRPDTVGRTLTASVAAYLPIAKNGSVDPQKKKQQAQQILNLANNYLAHWSDTHETPSSDRSHDRTPGGLEMAPYYGPGNDPYFAQGMKLIAEDSTLPQSLRDQALRLSDKMRTRLLTHADVNGYFPKREKENFPGENHSYQILMALALRNLPVAPPRPPSPVERLFRSAFGLPN